MASGSSWEDLRKQARQLENEIDLKLVAFSKLGTGTSFRTETSAEGAPLLGSDHVFETMALEIEALLEKLSGLNERLGAESEGKAPASSAALLHTLQRHREILQDYTQEFRKTQANFTARREREDLLRSVRKDIDKTIAPSLEFAKDYNKILCCFSNFKSSSGLNRRTDLYLKENEHIRSCDRLIDEQISIAVETRENLVTQRITFKKLQTRFNDISNRFPLINSLLQRVSFRKRRDSIVLGLVIGGCIVLMLLYAMH
ncbi:hypothetical protein B566_EDAN012030 [Ephemera danica]|nr:hypothetical protein B566_EDAN012030 [Ephemera danica]